VIRLSLIACVLLAGCSSAPPASRESLATSLEQIVGGLAAARSYAQAHESGNPFGLYVCEATVTLQLDRTATANGGIAFHVVSVGANGSNRASNTIEVKLQAPACNGKPTPAGPPLMLKRPEKD
jgi:hypothetical protein